MFTVTIRSQQRLMEITFCFEEASVNTITAMNCIDE